jgi:hypothetical protein
MRSYEVVGVDSCHTNYDTGWINGEEDVMVPAKIKPPRENDV